MAEDLSRPATLADLNEFERRFEGKMAAQAAQLEAKLTAQIETKMAAQTDILIERMRDMQTELLRGFADHAVVNDVRFRKLEADVNNVDAATSKRLAILERQVLEIWTKLAMDPPSAA